MFLIKKKIIKIKALHFPDVPETKTSFSKLFYKYSRVIYLPIQQDSTKYFNSTFEMDFK